MRTAIVSNIHGNRTAFEAVLKDLRAGHEGARRRMAPRHVIRGWAADGRGVIRASADLFVCPRPGTCR